MLPRLLHITKIYIRQKNTSNTLYDNNAREPIGRMARDTYVELDGQVRWNSQKVFVQSSGIVENTDGYVLFRTYDLNKAGVTLNQGDEIYRMGTGRARLDFDTKQGNHPQLYICGFDFRGHYADQGGHSLVKAWFKEKSPARR